MVKYYRFTYKSNVYHGTAEEISEEMGMTVKAIRSKSYQRNCSLEYIADKIPVYALYNGDYFLDSGTPSELGKKFGLDPKSIKYYSYSSVHDRMTGYRTLIIEGEYVIENIKHEIDESVKDKKVIRVSNKKITVASNKPVDKLNPNYTMYTQLLLEGCFKKWQQ